MKNFLFGLLIAVVFVNAAVSVWLLFRETTVSCTMTQFFDDSRIYAKVLHTNGKMARGYIICTF